MYLFIQLKIRSGTFLVVQCKNSPCNAGDTDSVPGQGANFPRALGHPPQTGQLLRLSALGPESQAREKPSDLNKRAHGLQLGSDAPK